MYGILFRVEAKPGKYEELIAHMRWVNGGADELVTDGAIVFRGETVIALSETTD